MNSPFSSYQNGISPVTGMSEAGANIGSAIGSGINNLAGGIQKYFENSAKWDMASSEADSIAQEVLSTQKILLSNPAYAPFAQHLNPVIEQLSSVKTKSLPQALGILNSAKASYADLGKQLSLYDMVRKDNELRLFNQGLYEKGPEGTVRTVPVATAPNDLLFDYNLTLDQNADSASAYYDKYAKAYPNVKMMPKDEWINRWFQNLPTQISADESVPKQVRDRAIENINMRGWFKDYPNEENWYSEFINKYDFPEFYNPSYDDGSVGSPVSSSATSKPQTIEQLNKNKQVQRKLLQDELENIAKQSRQLREERAKYISEWTSTPLLTNRTKEIDEKMSVLNQRMFTILKMLGDVNDNPKAVVSSGVSPTEPVPPVAGLVAPPKVEEKPRDTSIPPKLPPPESSTNEPIPPEPVPSIEYGKEHDVAGTSQAEKSANSIASQVDELRAKIMASDDEEEKTRLRKILSDLIQEGIRLRSVDNASKNQQGSSQAKQPPQETKPVSPVNPPEKTIPPRSGIKYETDENGILTDKGAMALFNDTENRTGYNHKELDSMYEEAKKNGYNKGMQSWLEEVAPKATPPPPSQQEASKQNEAPVSLPEPESAQPKQPSKPIVRAQPPALVVGPDYKYVRSSYGKNVFVYKYNNSTPKVKVPRMMQAITLEQQFKVPFKVLMDANGLTLNATEKEIFDASERNGGLIIPEKVNPSDVPSDIKIQKGQKFVGLGGGGGRFATILPNIKVDQEVEKEASKDTRGTVPVQSVSQRTSSNSEPIQPMLPEVSERLRIEAGVSPEDWAKIQTARAKIQSDNDSISKKAKARDDAIGYLAKIRDDVARGDSTLVDYGPYGQWENMNPEYATIIQVGTDAATTMIPISNAAKAAKAAGTADRAKFVAEAARVAQAKYAELVAKSAGEVSKINPNVRVVTDALKRGYMEKAIKEAGIQLKKGDLERYKSLQGELLKQFSKGTAWTVLFESMYGVQNEAPYSSRNDPDVKSQMDIALDEVRRLRTGYVPLLSPFGGKGNVAEAIGGWKPLTPDEQMNIVGHLDEKLKELKLQASEYKIEAKKNNEDLFDNSRLLQRFDSISAVNKKTASSYTPSAPTNAPSIMGGIEETIGPSNEQKKLAMRNFMIGRLGYVPSGFEEMYSTHFPETKLQIKETPYGVLYHDGKSWHQMSMKEGKSIGIDDVAKQKAFVFGELQENGTYRPTELVKGSGIKLGGIGAFGTAEQAAKFRTEYPKLFKARQLAKDLMAINEETFRSMDPNKWGVAAAKVSELIAQMRIALIGVGSVSDFEQELLRELVTDPTKFFTLQSTTRAKYNAMIENIDNSLLSMPQAYGLTVEMPEDRSRELKQMRLKYQDASGWSNLSQKQRDEIRKSVQK